MRIAIITQDEPLYLPPAIHALVQSLGGQVKVGVVLPSFNEGRVANVRRFLGLMGPMDCARLVRRYISAKVLNKVNGLRPITRPFSAQDAFRRGGVPVVECPDVNDPAFQARVLAPLTLDLIVSIAASQVFRSSLLDLPRLGCINLHSSPLPKYRGMMPNFWAMASGDAETCVTVHRMNDRLDAGGIVLQRPVPIPAKDTLDALMRRSKVVGAEALLEAIQRIDAGDLSTTPMDTATGSYHPFPTAEDAQRLRALGHRFF